MTGEEVIEAWDRIGDLGRLAFLFRSEFMKKEYPEDDDDFIQAVDRFSKGSLEDLPFELEDEFARYSETSRFQQIWMKKGGE